MDLISREETIKAFKKYGIDDEYDCEGIINELPTIESRPTGKWTETMLMDMGGVEIECSICGDTVVRAKGYKPNFCEYCGADMRGEE